MSLQGNLGRIFFSIYLLVFASKHTHVHKNTNKRVLTLWTFGWLSCCDSGRRTMNTALQKSQCVIWVTVFVTAEHKFRSHELRRMKQLFDNYRHMFSKHEGIKKWQGPLNFSIRTVVYFVLRYFLLRQEVWGGTYQRSFFKYLPVGSM